MRRLIGLLMALLFSIAMVRFLLGADYLPLSYFLEQLSAISDSFDSFIYSLDMLGKAFLGVFDAGNPGMGLLNFFFNMPGQVTSAVINLVVGVCKALVQAFEILRVFFGFSR